MCQNLDGDHNGQTSIKTPLGILLLKIFKLLSRNSASNRKKCQLWHFYSVARISSHYHIQLNNCTKPFINGHLWWVKYPNLLLGYHTCEGHLASLGGPAWKGLWHSQEWVIREKRKGHFPPLRAFHSAVQAWSYWVLLTPPLWNKHIDSGICTSWSQVTKSLQNLLHLIVSLWLTELAFAFAFGSSQGLAKATNCDGASNQDDTWSTLQPSLSCLMHLPVLTVNIT